MNSNRCEKSSWVVYTLFIFGAIWTQNVKFVQGSDDADDIKSVFENLYKTYQQNAKSITSDCNVQDINADDKEHHGWGTLTTLRFLAESSDFKVKLDHGELLTNRTKLRIFLARIGYLKVPGSLIFLNEQADTLRLEGCTKGTPQWRLQGEKSMENTFFYTGTQLKIAAPNAENYAHKFTCSIPDSCSHTFYVITKMKPEVPASMLIRKGDKMDKGSFEFGCFVPFCSVKECHIGKTSTVAQNRPFPPFTLSWNLKSRDPVNDIYQGKNLKKFADKNSMITKENQETVKKELGITVIWENFLRKDDDSAKEVKDSYEAAKDELWIDAFGDNHKPANMANSNYSFSSRIIIENPDKENHGGSYECVIEDGNGVASTPNVFLTTRDWEEYAGRTSVFIIDLSLYLTICFGVALACVVLTAIAILLCPKKMEYDDGTPYTKDELVAPSKKQESTSQVTGSDVKSKKSGKTVAAEKTPSSIKQHTE